MKSRLLGGLAALVLAVVGAILLFVYVEGASARAQAGLDPVTVLVVTEAVPAGTTSSDLAGKVRSESLPKSAVPDGALASLDQQDGKVTAVALQPGEQLLGARLVDPKSLMPGTVPVPAGLGEVTFLLAPERILGGRLQAGDKVTVFSSFAGADGSPNGAKQSTGLLFHDVLVTAIQQAPPQTPKTNSGSASASTDAAVAMPNGSAFVTVARSDAEAAKLVFAAEFGTLWLSKQTDTTVKSNPPLTTLGGLY